MKKIIRKKKIFILINLIAYLCCVVILIFESCLNGTSSAAQSNKLGEQLANTINNLGEQDEIIMPEKVTITNKIFVGNIKDEYLLNLETYPSNASFTSYLYESNNTTVAEINELGKIYFKNEGVVTFTITNKYAPEVKDEMSVNVVKKIIPLTSLNVKIASNSEYQYQDDIYTLYTNFTYQLIVDVLPENANDYLLSYVSSNEEIVSITNDGTITPHNITSTDQIITLTVQSGDIYQNLKIKIEEYYPSTTYPDLEAINLTTVQSRTLAVDQRQNITNYLEFYPNNAQDRSFSYEIISQTDFASNPQSGVIEIENLQIVAKTLGKAIIRIISNANNKIYVDLPINVEEIPLQRFTLVGNTTMQVNQEATLSLKNHFPSDASCVKASDKSKYQGGYTTSDESIIQVDESGHVLALSEGSATITYTYYNYQNDGSRTKDEDGNDIKITSSITINVVSPQEIDDYEYEIKKDSLAYYQDDTAYIYTDNDYNLNDLIQVTALKKNNIKVTSSSISKNFNYQVLGFSSSSNYALSQDEEKNLHLIIYRASSFVLECSLENGVSKTFNFIAYNSFKFTLIEDYTSTNGIYGKEGQIETTYDEKDVGRNLSLNLNVGVPITIIYDQNNTAYQYYSHQYSKSDIASIGQYHSLGKNEFTLDIMKNGSLNFKFVPYIFGSVGDRKEITFSLNLQYNYLTASDFSITLIDQDNNYLDVSTITNGVIQVDVLNQGKYQLDLIFQSDYPLQTTNVTYQFSNPDICQMNNNQIKFLTYGTTTLTIKEEYSGIVHKIKFNIQNVVEIDEITPFSFKNDNYTYNNDTDYYCFNSGEANQLSFNFLSTSTYSTITYTSSNEDVIIINEDGTITPLNEGKAIITAKINDQNGVNIIYQIKVQVKSKKLITNMNTFLHYVRKGIGHFGAFFVLGIFSTNFYITYFDKKKWYASIPFNYLQGIFIALVSELIQVYVPGRSGRMKDVLIDTCGFLLSSTIITITIIILYLIPLIQARKKIKSKK